MTPLLEASALAGETPLRLASSFDFTWDFSLYSEGMMALDTAKKRVEYISVNRQISQHTTDPDYKKQKSMLFKHGRVKKKKNEEERKLQDS